jgi:hypothetical protein
MNDVGTVVFCFPIVALFSGQYAPEQKQQRVPQYGAVGPSGRRVPHIMNSRSTDTMDLISCCKVQQMSIICLELYVNNGSGDVHLLYR